MANKRLDSDDKSARITVRLPAEEKERIVLAARLQGVSASAFVLRAATEAAAEVIPSGRVELGEAASLQVAQALSRPARAVPELVKLFGES